MYFNFYVFLLLGFQFSFIKSCNTHVFKWDRELNKVLQDVQFFPIPNLCLNIFRFKKFVQQLIEAKILMLSQVI